MEIFWLILVVGALLMLIPAARQVFRRSDGNRGESDQGGDEK